MRDVDQGVESAEGSCTGVQHEKAEKGERNSAIEEKGIEKKKEIPFPNGEGSSWQASRAENTVVADAVPEADPARLSRRPEGEETSGGPDDSTQGSTSGRPAVWGIAAAERTQKTFELAGKIGRKPLSILLDSGSTGNFVSARICTAIKLKPEKDANPEELKMADGSIVKTEGKVQIQLRCGKYRRVVQAKVFPGL